MSASEQMLIDCDKKNLGCNGGWPPHALEYISRFGLTEALYSYANQEEVSVCKNILQWSLSNCPNLKKVFCEQNLFFWNDDKNYFFLAIFLNFLKVPQI